MPAPSPTLRLVASTIIVDGCYDATMKRASMFALGVATLSLAACGSSVSASSPASSAAIGGPAPTPVVTAAPAGARDPGYVSACNELHLGFTTGEYSLINDGSLTAAELQQIPTELENLQASIQTLASSNSFVGGPTGVYANNLGNAIAAAQQVVAGNKPGTRGGIERALKGACAASGTW